MADVQVLSLASPFTPTTEQQPPNSPARMRTYCSNLATQNGSLQRRLQRSEESNAFLKAHAEQLKFEIAQLKAEMAAKARNVMALQFKLLRQDLLGCAAQATARRSVQEKERACEEARREAEGLREEKRKLEAEVERLGFAVTGVQYVADKLEERNKDLEARNRELEEQVARVREEKEELEARCAEKDAEVRRTREKMEVLEEYVAASKAADDLVSDTFTTVLATLDAWKRGDEADEDEEDDAYHGVEVPTIVVSEAEDDRIVSRRREDDAWSHEAILDSWTAPPATDADAAACPSSLSCTIPLPSSPSGLGIEDSPITPTTPLARIDEEDEEPETESSSTPASRPHFKASSGSFEGDMPGSPTVVGSGSDLDTESESESLADDEQETPSSRPKVYDSSTDSPLLMFRNFAHGIPEEEFAPLIHERFSPIDVRFENSDDEACSRLAASLMRKRSNSLSSIGTCDGLETFRREFAHSPVVPSPLGRRRQDRLSCRRRPL